MPLRFWDNGRHLSVHLTHTDSSKCTICQLGTLETPLHAPLPFLVASWSGQLQMPPSLSVSLTDGQFWTLGFGLKGRTR
ncbi:hypothetical protein CDAR_180441 [Caerostris darwini]|uniref:Uncharacterized protein n=1 Tax=Caerostris darwini TaxID=1538125 RepID=A0AAV4NS23_9ARAC|nr:hypothetical protein CDAR_180441 [Caerostris darwini]